MSNPKHRTPIPDTKEEKKEILVDESLDKVHEKVIAYLEKEEKGDDEPETIIHHPDTHILSAKLAKENPELVEQFDKLADAMYTADPEWQAIRLNSEIYWQKNIFTRAIARFGRWIRW